MPATRGRGIRDGFERPIATVDVVVFTLDDGELRVALHERQNEPFAGTLALPGGYVHVDADADLDATARRVLRDKADLRWGHLEQLATFSGVERDPRGWSLSAAYLAVVPVAELVGAPNLHLVSPTSSAVGRALPFDHGAIVAAAVDRLRSKSVYSTLPTFLVPSPFTIAELRDVYQLVLGIDRLDLAGFRKKILDVGAVEPVAGELRTGAHRPAQLYRRTVGDVAVFDRTI
ncbi:MAG: NUDIX hydrolase [Actinomycetota bacterium]